MLKRLNKNVILAFVFLFLFSPLFRVSAISLLNSDVVDKNMRTQDDAFQASAGFSETTNTSAAEIVAMVIKAFIGLLGVIFVVLIVYSGYNWMTAGGDESKITKAKETITRAIIGLVLILAAYSITYFVFSNLDSVTGGGGGITGSP